MDITSLHAKNPKDLWKKVYERIFPPEVDQPLTAPSPLSSDLGMYIWTVFTVFCLLVALQTTGEQRELKDPAKDQQYSEPQIDSMRSQKDQVSYLEHLHNQTKLIVNHHYEPGQTLFSARPKLVTWLIGCMMANHSLSEGLITYLCDRDFCPTCREKQVFRKIVNY